MDIFDSVWHVYSLVILFFLGLVLSTRVGRFFGISDKMGVLIYIWHSLFCFVYFAYSLSYTADSTLYYLESIGFQGDFGVGTAFIRIFTSIFSDSLGLSYLGCFLIFNFLGYIGLLAYYAALRSATLYKSKQIRWLGFLLIFLPSVSFWSSAIGKDSIAFFAVGLMLWFALDTKKRLGYFIVAVISMMLVRPHIGAIMIAAYTLSFVFDKRVSLLRRLILGIISITISVAVVPFAMEYAGLGDAENASDVEGYINTRQNSNLSGGSSVDISSMSFPMQLATYMFRPLPFEAGSIFGLLASFDNIVLLVLSIIWFRSYLKKYKPSISSNRRFLLIYAIVTWSILALTTANLGIAMRQKWMFVPILVFLMLSVVGRRSNQKDTIGS